jgi:hypothetical protein
MDTRTGEIHELPPGESIRDLARRLGGKVSDFVQVATNTPNATCKKCDGNGFVKRGLNSKRFKPCKCVL